MLPGVCAASENCSTPQSTQELEANLRKVSQSRRMVESTYIIAFSHLRICYAKHLITIHRQSKGHKGWAGCFSI